MAFCSFLLLLCPWGFCTWNVCRENFHRNIRALVLTKGLCRKKSLPCSEERIDWCQIQAWPWPWRGTVVFTLNFSRQQQAEECIPRHPQQFSAGISPRREHTPDWSNQTREMMMLARPTVPGFCCNIWASMKLAEYRDFYPSGYLFWNGLIEAKNILSWKRSTMGIEVQLPTPHRTSQISPTGHDFFHCCSLPNLMRILCCSGINTVVFTSPITTTSTRQDIQVKRPNKAPGVCTEIISVLTLKAHTPY